MFIAIVASIVIVTVFVIIFSIIFLPKSKNMLLVNACSDGNHDAAAAALKKGANDWSALGLAAGRGHADIVALLLDAGAPIPTDDDETVGLTRAALNGHFDVVKLLLERGANPDSTDRHGRSALAHAYFKGHSTVAKLLEEYGAKDVPREADSVKTDSTSN